MKYAVIQTGGKQYKVSEGDTIEVERLTATQASSMVFNEVLLSVIDGDIKIGTPYITDMTVSADVVAHTKGEKIRVAKYKAKSRYRRTTGHRQALTQVKITQIGATKTKKSAASENDAKPALKASEKKSTARVAKKA